MTYSDNEIRNRYDAEICFPQRGTRACVLFGRMASDKVVHHILDVVEIRFACRSDRQLLTWVWFGYAFHFLVPAPVCLTGSLVGNTTSASAIEPSRFRLCHVRVCSNLRGWRFRLDKGLAIRFILILVILVLCNLVSTSSAQVRGLPDQISDQDFWCMITELSEPSGQYSGDNWISNEPTIQDVIPPLKQLIKPGGVYLGVGPEQNFTYMWALQSKIGFLIDIRRQNMLDILLFKALFEMAPDRADFMSLLFSRRRPDGLNASTSAAALMASYEAAPREGFAVNMERVRSICQAISRAA
jgi:hypothetical protein